MTFNRMNLSEDEARFAMKDTGFANVVGILGVGTEEAILAWDETPRDMDWLRARCERAVAADGEGDAEELLATVLDYPFLQLVTVDEEGKVTVEC